MEETRVGDTKKACVHFRRGGRRAILHEAEQQRKGGVTEFERFLSFPPPPPPPPSFQPPARHSRRELRRERYSNSNSLALSLSPDSM